MDTKSMSKEAANRAWMDAERELTRAEKEFHDLSVKHYPIRTKLGFFLPVDRRLAEAKQRCKDARKAFLAAERREGIDVEYYPETVSSIPASPKATRIETDPEHQNLR